MTSSIDQLISSSFQRHLAVQYMEMTTCASNAENVIVLLVILLVIGRHTEPPPTRKRESVHTVRRCTFQCPPTVCMYVHILKGVSVSTVVRSSVDHGYSRDIFEHIPARNHSAVPHATNLSRTSLTCARISRHIRARNHLSVGDAARLLRWRVICTSMKSRLVWEGRDLSSRNTFSFVVERKQTLSWQCELFMLYSR